MDDDGFQRWLDYFDCEGEFIRLPEVGNDALCWFVWVPDKLNFAKSG